MHQMPAMDALVSQQCWTDRVQGLTGLWNYTR